MNLLSKWLDKLDNLLVFISGCTLFVMTVWIFIDVVMRYFFNNALTGTLELTGEYFLVIIVFLSLSYTQRENGNVNVDLAYNMFPRTIKKIVLVITNLIALALFIIVGLENFREGLRYLDRDIQSVGVLNYPLAPALFVISFGILVLCLRLIFDSINVLRNKKEV